MSAQEHVDLKGEGEPIAANTKQRFLGLQKKTAFPSWVSAKATPESHKNSEHQTRKEAGKIWLFSFDAL